MPKHKCPAFENHERWLVSYADMVTLLFAVFVVLYALKESGEKSEDAAGSLEESFNKPLEDIPPANRDAAKDGGFGIFESLKKDSPEANLIPSDPSSSSGIKIIDHEMNLVSRQLEERLYGSQKFPNTSDPGSSRIVSIMRMRTGFKVKLLGVHFYEAGKIDMKPSALKSLDEIIKVVKSLGREIRVEGHTDSLKRGDMTNWDVSSLRASHILDYMVTKHQFPPSQLSAVGFGDARPMASNSTESGRAMNRRIEFFVRYDQDQGQEQK